MSISNYISLNSPSLIIETIDYYLKHINILYYQSRQSQKKIGNNKDLYVCFSIIQVFSNEKLNCSNWIGWSLGDVFVHFLTLVAAFWTSKHLPPWGIFHCKVFSEVTFWAARSFPPRDTLGPGCNFFHHQTLSTIGHFPHRFYFVPQDIFSFNFLALNQLRATKIWKSLKKIIIPFLR